MAALNNREELDRPVFPAHYDRCWHSALDRSFVGWTDITITPLYHGATYFHFSRLLTRLYLAYENMICRYNVQNLATHYLIVATK